MSTCPTPPARPRRRPVPPPPQEIAEGEPVPPGMVRLLSGQLVTEEDASQVIPGQLPPEARWPEEGEPTRETPEAPTYRREPAGACCAHTFDPEALHDELDALRAERAQLREDLARSEGRAEGERAAYERVIASLLASRPVPVAPAVTQPRQRDVTLRSVTVQRDSVTGSVTEEEEKRKRELAAERQRNRRVRKRDSHAVTLNGSVTQEKESSPPSPSVQDERGARRAVTQAQRDGQRDAAADSLREHRKPETLPAPVQALRAAWNELAAPHGFAPWGERTSRQLLADALEALRRRPVEEWRDVFALVPRSPVCRGELSSRQRTSLVYVLKGTTRGGYEVAEQLLSGAWSVDPLPSQPAEASSGPGALPETPHARAWRQALDMLDADGRAHVVGQLRLRVSPVVLEDGHLVLACADAYVSTWLAEDGVLELVRQVLRALGHEGVRLVAPEAPVP
ncbi:hypothetical protein HRD49_06930, partial [Corallococcus exiguus]|uniref:hypothetical protein n=1 Tax=Corallococcus exiguus TaxID=83462 RepID=UPI001561A8C1